MVKEFLRETCNSFRIAQNAETQLSPVFKGLNRYFHEDTRKAENGFESR